MATYRVARQGGIKLGGKHVLPLGAIVEPLARYEREVERLVRQGYLLPAEGAPTFKFPDEKKEKA